MTDKGMSVGLLCSVIGHTVGFGKGKWPGSVWEGSMEGKERHWNEINRTKRSKAFSGHQRVSECFVKAGLRALISQLYEAFSGHYADQVTHKWKACELERNEWITSVIEVKYKWLLSVPDEMQVPAECLASARRGRAADHVPLSIHKQCRFFKAYRNLWYTVCNCFPHMASNLV